MQMFLWILFLLRRCLAKNPTFCLHKTNCKFELQQNYFVVTSNAFCGVKICTWSIFFSSEYLFEVFLIGSHKREKKIFFSCCFCLCIYIRFRFQHHKGSNNNTIGKLINKDWRTNCSWIVFAFVQIFVILFGFGWDWEIIRLCLMTKFNIRPTYLWTFFIEAQKLKLQGGGGPWGFLAKYFDGGTCSC